MNESTATSIFSFHSHAVQLEKKAYKTKPNGLVSSLITQYNQLFDSQLQDYNVMEHLNDSYLRLAHRNTERLSVDRNKALLHQISSLSETIKKRSQELQTLDRTIALSYYGIQKEIA